VDKMAAKAKPKKTTASVTKRVIDNKSYVEIGQPKSGKFGNSEKSIDEINTKYTHRIVEHYALT
jgi:hypothetical protein